MVKIKYFNQILTVMKFLYRMNRSLILLVMVFFVFQPVIYSHAKQMNDDNNGDWTIQQVTLTNTSEANLMVRAGDIDNLGFGWPQNFDPFSEIGRASCRERV